MIIYCEVHQDHVHELNLPSDSCSSMFRIILKLLCAAQLFMFLVATQIEGITQVMSLHPALPPPTVGIVNINIAVVNICTQPAADK